MTLLQVRTAAPQAFNFNDLIAIGNSAAGFVTTALPKLIGIAYLVVVCVILWRLWKNRSKDVPNMELIALAIMFGLMR